jgi:membrane-bound serine protease (ClpP class)
VQYDPTRPHAGWRTIRLAMLVLAACLLAWPAARAQAPPAGRTALVLDVQGGIGPATAGYLRHALEAAATENAALIVLRIDTPGGLSSAMRDIIQDMLASPVPVVAYVAPSGARAASAGTYILYASHLAAMAPGTNLGAATPVQLGGGGEPAEDGKPDPETAKAVNDAVAYIRGLAELSGRNADWAEAAVREAASLTASAALERHVIEIVATDLDDLLAQANGRTVRLNGRDVTLHTKGLAVREVEPGWRVRLLAAITDPNVAYILLLVGIYGIIFEFFAPGTALPGTAGAIALLVGLFALNLLPIDLAGTGLVLLGIALMVAEAFAPSFGALGIGGAIAFALGSLFMFEDVPGFSLSLPVVLTATAASLALFGVMLTAVVRAHRRRTVSGDAVLLGAPGRVLSWSVGEGQVHVHGERWQARAAVPLAPGARIRVVGRDRLVLHVEPASHPDGEP